MMQSQQASIRTLEAQMGQIVSALNNRPQGNLPSHTEANPKDKEQCKAITLRSGKEVQSDTKKEVQGGSGTSMSRGKQERVVEATVDDGGALELTKQQQNMPSNFYAPPFPQRLKKLNDDTQFLKFLDVFKKLQINIPFADALE